jgi:hypothetical protein
MPAQRKAAAKTDNAAAPQTAEAKLARQAQLPQGKAVPIALPSKANKG